MKEAELAGFKALFKRRLAGEPVQYVTGTAAFMLGEFEVGPAVLIPRPETEALTEVVLRLLGELRGAAAGSADAADFTAVVADIGTGSGVIAVSVAREGAGARVYATDVSAAALEVAARNAEKAGVAERVDVPRGRDVTAAPWQRTCRWRSALVSNPPYVPTGELAGLPAEVRDFEPREALDGGDGRA